MVLTANYDKRSTSRPFNQRPVSTAFREQVAKQRFRPLRVFIRGTVQRNTRHSVRTLNIRVALSLISAPRLRTSALTLPADARKTGRNAGEDVGALKTLCAVSPVSSGLLGGVVCGTFGSCAYGIFLIYLPALRSPVECHKNVKRVV